MKGISFLIVVLAIVSCSQEVKKPKAQPAPTLPGKSTEILRDDANAIVIQLNSGTSAMIDGVVVDSNLVKDQLRRAKKEKGDTATVVLHVKGDTEFGVFANVHQSLEELLLEERDSVAKRRFDALYDQLSVTQQAIIKRKHHLRIIEKMSR